MSVVIELPPELERRVIAEAARNGTSPEATIVSSLDEYLPPDPKPKTGAEVLEFWKREGLLGIWADRTDIPDSPEYARQLRLRAQGLESE